VRMTPFFADAARRLHIALVAGVLLVLCSSAFAQQMPAATQREPAPDIELRRPSLSFAHVDWDAARGALAAIDPRGSAAPDAVTLLNSANDGIFSNIASSPVPVLLPFDTAAFLRDANQGAANETSKYLSGSPAFFFAGASGYDAVISLRPLDVFGLDLSFVKRIDVQISGSKIL
jgi:hypothetical protein